MLKLIMAFLFCLASSIANAQIEGKEVFQLKKPMTCLNVQSLMDYLVKEYNEKMMWIGQEDSTGTYISLYKNTQTGSWTMIQFDSSIGCFLGHGIQGSPT